MRSIQEPGIAANTATKMAAKAEGVAPWASSTGGLRRVDADQNP